MANQSRIASYGEEMPRGSGRRRWSRGLVLAAVLGGVAVLASGTAIAGSGRSLSGANAILSTGALTACYGTKTTVKFLSNPIRILDTRDGTGVASAGVRPAGTTTTVATSGTIPGAVGVIGNVTVTGEASTGYLTVWPGGTQPGTSTINFTPGVSLANHVQSGLASDGTFKIYNAVATHEIFDVLAGIYPVSKALRLIDPSTESCASDETQTYLSQGPSFSSFTPTCDLNVPGAVSTTPTNMGTIGTFNKSSANTKITVQWGGHVTAATVTNAVYFYLRVDGNAAVGGQASGLFFSQDATKYVYTPMTAVFTGLAAGAHNVQMWVAIPNGSASGVAENPGCYSETVVVEEE